RPFERAIPQAAHVSNRAPCFPLVPAHAAQTCQEWLVQDRPALSSAGHLEKSRHGDPFSSKTHLRIEALGYAGLRPRAWTAGTANAPGSSLGFWRRSDAKTEGASRPGTLRAIQLLNSSSLKKTGRR